MIGELPDTDQLSGAIMDSDTFASLWQQNPSGVLTQLFKTAVMEVERVRRGAGEGWRRTVAHYSHYVHYIHYKNHNHYDRYNDYNYDVCPREAAPSARRT